MTEKIKARYNWAYKAFVVAILGAMATGLVAYVPGAMNRVENLTFDTPEQKMKVIETAQQPHIITEAERERIFTHIKDENKHMTFEEKVIIIQILENQRRIGQDLDQIKNLVKTSNNENR